MLKIKVKPQNTASVKFTVSYYTGIKCSDGSEWYDIALFKTEKQKDQFITQLNLEHNKYMLNHEYTCDKCEKPAIINLQNQWHEYEITKNGDFNETNSWEGDTNEFYCNEHRDEANI